MRNCKGDTGNAIDSRMVAKCDKNGIIIQKYESVKEAANSNNVFASDIRQAAQGKIDKIGNYYWIYIFDDDFQQNIYLQSLKGALTENGYSCDFVNSFANSSSIKTQTAKSVEVKNTNEGLKDLFLLIKQSTIHFNRDFVWQDVILKENFKECYENYLNGIKWKIEFFQMTAVLSSPTTKNIFVPNQWFVVAAYAVGVYMELQKYKKTFERTADRLGEKYDTLAKTMRDNTQLVDKIAFLDAATIVLQESIDSEEIVEQSAKRLWRFATDYSWWSGQKTIDRHDYFQSVVLNMLNLVNSSQGYVGDIVNAYGNDKRLFSLVRLLEDFTVNLEGETFLDRITEEKELPQEVEIVKSANGIPTKHKITISANSIKKIGGK